MCNCSSAPAAPAGPDQIPLYPDETLEDLQRYGLRLIQKKDGFRSGEAAVWLAAFTAAAWEKNPRRTLRFAELGCGSGMATLLLSARLKRARGVGLEISARQAELLNRNIRLNQLDSRLSCLQADISELARTDLTRWPALLQPFSLDFVMTNPPFFTGRSAPDGKGNLTRLWQTPQAEPGAAERRGARFEQNGLTFSLTARLTGRLLRHHGRLHLLHTASRLPELFQELIKAELMPESVRGISSQAGRPAELVFITAVKGGRPGGFRLEPTLEVRGADGRLSPAAQAIYGSEAPLPAARLRERVKMMDNTMLRRTEA
ncbi:methyltransferase [Oscillospiraceae bacterium HV4-5-C5C]|nr:methyltransferase [Oscillospiraceae bacterium HV4-5-C5C]